MNINTELMREAVERNWRLAMRFYQERGFPMRRTPHHTTLGLSTQCYNWTSGPNGYIKLGTDAYH